MLGVFSLLGSSHQVGIFIVNVYGCIAVLMLFLGLKTVIVHFTATESDFFFLAFFDLQRHLSRLNTDRSSCEYRADRTRNGHVPTFVLVGHHMLILVPLEVSLHHLSFTKPTRQFELKTDLEVAWGKTTHHLIGKACLTE